MLASSVFYMLFVLPVPYRLRVLTFVSCACVLACLCVCVCAWGGWGGNMTGKSGRAAL